MAVCLILVAFSSIDLLSQNDPGPRPGSAAAGSFYRGLNSNEQAFFNQAQRIFQEIDSVSGSIAGEEGTGLGPAFNGNSCAQCHAQPAVGGSSPGLMSPQNSVPNPQVQLATLHGATNSVPSFITPDGPVREARFIRNPNGSLDGGVHDLYTIAGRTDAVGCTLGAARLCRCTSGQQRDLPHPHSVCLDWVWWKLRQTQLCSRISLPRNPPGLPSRLAAHSIPAEMTERSRDLAGRRRTSRC